MRDKERIQTNEAEEYSLQEEKENERGERKEFRRKYC